MLWPSSWTSITSMSSPSAFRYSHNVWAGFVIEGHAIFCLISQAYPHCAKPRVCEMPHSITFRSYKELFSFLLSQYHQMLFFKFFPANFSRHWYLCKVYFMWLKHFLPFVIINAAPLPKNKKCHFSFHCVFDHVLKILHLSQCTISESLKHEFAIENTQAKTVTWTKMVAYCYI